jgi:hypothetical protein
MGGGAGFSPVYVHSPIPRDGGGSGGKVEGKERATEDLEKNAKS